MTYAIDAENNGKNYKFRRILSQLIASTAAFWLLFGSGLCVTFPFIVIAALTGFHNKHNVGEIIRLTPVEASWFASIQFISGTIGSILAAMFTDNLGRKNAMMIVNVPFFIAWYLMHSASEISDVFVANILLGLGNGFVQATVMTYVGDVSQPKLRGFMSAYANIGYELAIVMVATLNTQLPWRSVGLVCMFVPICAATTLFFMPESPLWLLSKDRTTEAESSLQWLRGWVSEEEVAQELRELKRYSRRYKSCDSCIKKDLKCTHPPPTLKEKLVEFKRKQTLKPLFIVTALFLISAYSQTFFMPTYIVQILTAYNVPLDSDHAAAVLSYAINLADLAALALIRFTGKRKLYLAMLTMLFLSAVTICAYGFIVLPSGYSSYPHITPNFPLPNKQLGYIPFICIIVACFSMYCAISVMPWAMMSELFPYKTRGTATGLSAALSYFVLFIGVKSFHCLDTTLSMPGVSLLNCTVIFIGLVLMYNILPETEGRTLEDIEMHFADNSKKITNRKIPKKSKKTTETDVDFDFKPKDDGNVLKRVILVGINEQSINQYQKGCDNCGYVRDG